MIVLRAQSHSEIIYGTTLSCTREAGAQRCPPVEGHVTGHQPIDSLPAAGGIRSPSEVGQAVLVLAGPEVFFGRLPVGVVRDRAAAGGVGVRVSDGVDADVADDVEVDGVLLVPGVQDLVDGEFDAVGGAGRALDLYVAFLGASGTAQVVGLAELLDRPALCLVVDGGEFFGVLLNGFALLGIGDVAGSAAAALPTGPMSAAPPKTSTQAEPGSSPPHRTARSSNTRAPPKPAHRDRPARLQGQLPARSRLPTSEAHLTPARDGPAALAPFAGWILRRPEALTETEQLHLRTVRAHCPELDALVRHVRSFATMLTERRGERLLDWLDAVRQDDLPSLHTLAAGIDRDRDAVIAGLTLPWNSGVVEGHVNRIKMFKRQMFGRAGFDLLRKRVLLAS